MDAVDGLPAHGGAGMGGQLESEEVARRLGVQIGTVYAYVSRGLLVSHPAPSGRRRLFDVDDVEQLARRSRRGKAVETRMVTVTTGITQLRDDGPAYRGRPAVDLAGTETYEDVAEWLWSGSGRTTLGTAGHSPGEDRSAAWEVPVLGAPPDVGRANVMRWAVVMAGALDPLRADQRPLSVHRAARRVVGALVGSLPTGGAADGVPTVPLVVSGNRSRSDTVSERMTVALCPTPTPAVVQAMNTALVLLADHELATSTLAVRVAASTRSDPYDAMLAGLATMAGALHGGASQLAHALLEDAAQVGVERALDDALRWHGGLPGFGHVVYSGGDPRFSTLLDRFEVMATPEQRALVRSVVETAAAHDVAPPNIDLALAAMTWAAGMPRDAGRCLVTVARVAGWAAHYLEELGERPLRFRARAVYANPAAR